MGPVPIPYRFCHCPEGTACNHPIYTAIDTDRATANDYARWKARSRCMRPLNAKELARALRVCVHDLRLMR